MKHKISIATAITALFIAYACDEKYEPIYFEDYSYTPILSTFFAGDKDSCTYYDYDPDIVLSIEYLNKGYFDYSQSIDIDEDGIEDFAIVINGYKDGANIASNYWRTISLQSLTGYKVSHGWVTSYFDSTGVWITENNIGANAVKYGDTLTNYSFERYHNGDKFQMIETGYNYEANSYDTCCGYWNTWGEDRYIGFRKIDEDTTLGWMRLELSAESDHIIIKDCAIQKFSEKRNK